MISEAEIRRLAARWQTDPMILDEVVTFEEAWHSTIDVIQQAQRIIRQ